MRLGEAVESCTRVYRKGAQVETREVNGFFRVVEIFGYPLAPDGADVQDMIFVNVAVDKAAAEAAWPAVEEILRRYPEPERLRSGPSYIELAPALDVQQETILRLMAMGAALGKWQVLSGKTIGMSDDEARSLAGDGFLMISGWAAN